MLIGVAYNPLNGIAVWHDITTTAQEDANLQAGLTVMGGQIPPGLAIAVVSKDDVAAQAAQNPLIATNALENVAAVVQAKHGVSIQRAPRCAVIDTTQQISAGAGLNAVSGHPVVNVIMADPSTFVVQNSIVMAHPSASVGDIYNPATQTISSPPVSVGAVTA